MHVALGVYDAKYIGSVPVPELKGKLVVDQALQRARVRYWLLQL